MMCAVRRRLLLLGLLVGAAFGFGFGPGLGFGPAFGAGRPASAGAAVAPSVRTPIGPAALDSPGGIALDAAGDLFVADTGHCRVLVLAARPSNIDGVRVRSGRTSVLAGGHCGGKGSIGYPSDVAVDGHGDVFVALNTSDRVDEVRASHGEGTSLTRGGGPPGLVPVLGTGQAGFNGDGRAGTATELDHPGGIAVDAVGDLFVADTANCRVRVLPARSGTIFGQPVTAGRVSTVAGTGVCGTAGQGGPAGGAQLWSPVAVALDDHGNLLVADSGDQSVLLLAAQGGTFYGTTVGTDDIRVVVGGTQTYGPYLADGQSATGIAAELNDPRAVAVGPTGALFVTDGFMRAIRVVPASTGPLLGRSMSAGDLYTAAGALPVETASGLGNGTRWILTTMGTPVGIAVSPSGAVTYSDGSLDTVRVIAGDRR
jgi:NHL repeat